MVIGNKGRSRLLFPHLVLSPPLDMLLDMISPNPTKRKVLNKLFDVDKVLLKECGSVYGSIMIFHPYRIRGVVDDDSLIEGIRWSEIKKKENAENHTKWNLRSHKIRGWAWIRRLEKR